MTERRSSGIRAWIIQRISAIYLALFILFLLIKISLDPPLEYQQWMAWVAHPVVNVGIGLFFLSLLIHAWVGLRDVIMDYIKPAVIRAVLFALLIVTLTGCALWSLRLLLKVAS